MCDNVLEHITDTLSIMREMWRVTKPTDTVKIVTPYASNPNFWSTPDHVKTFTFT